MEEMLASSPQTTAYRSKDPATGCDVVVKLLTSDTEDGDQATRQHFLRAMGAVQFLRLPAFPKLHDFGLSAEQNAFMVMDWVEGVCLTELKGQSPKRIIRPLLQVIEALEALAMGDIFHHNLSPTNIIVTSNEGVENAQIIGFGTAAYLTETAAGPAAMLGHSPDSDLFIAPERLDPETAEAAPGALSDLYSLALITTEMLGGRLGSGDTGFAVRFDPAQRARLGDPDQLEAVLTGALQIEPEDRTSTYPLLRLALEAAAVAPSEPSTVPARDVDLQTDPDEVTATISKAAAVPSPPPLPGAGPDASAPEDETVLLSPPPAPAPAPIEPTGEETVILSAPDDLDDTDPDLDDTDPDIEDPAHTFDPNKTDPVFHPGLLKAPPVGAQPPPIEDSPPAAASPVAPRRKAPMIAIAAAVVVTLIVGAGITIVLRIARRPKPQPVAQVVIPTPIPPTPVPRPTPEAATMNAALEEADALLLEGDVEGARAALAGLAQETIDAFTEEESELYAGIVNALTGTRLDSAISDLEGGLTHGSIRMLKRAVAGLSRFKPSEYADRRGVKQNLARAQAALGVHAQLWKAHDSGNRSAELQFSAAMIEQLPGYSMAYTFRDEAASSLESESDAAALAGDLDEAERLLAPVKEFWPDREGLDRRMTTIASSREQMNSQLAVIEEALSKGWDGDPAAGLRILGAVSPLPLLEPRFAKTRLLLEEQLTEADAQPPSIVLAADVKPSFKKKRAVEIELVVTDDYRVAGVLAFLKKKDATSYSKITVNQAGAADHYLLRISPEDHGNEDFVIYFEASDTSGHVSRLGEPGEPLEFTRKKGLKAIFSK